MMNQKTIFIGLLAGLATTVMSIGANMGTPLAMPLFIFSPLAILIAGLGWGTASAIIASLVASALIFGFSSPSHAGVSALLTFIPAAWAAHMAGLSRSDENGSEWYPLSELLFRLALYMAAAFCVVGYIINFNIPDVSLFIEPIYRQLIDPNQVSITPEQMNVNIADISKFYARLLPYTMPAFWLMLFVVNLYIAAKITRASNMMLRPQDDIPLSTSLPKFAVAICVITFIASLPEGALGQMAATFAGSFIMGFGLVALAFVHTITRGKTMRFPVLFALYVSAILFGFPLFLLAVVGIGETLFNWRYKFAKS